MPPEATVPERLDAVASRMTEIDAGAVKVAVILEGLIRTPLDRGTAHHIEAHVGICLPTDNATIKAADHPARVAGLPPEPGHQVPLLDGRFEKQRGDAGDLAVVVELVLLGSGKSELGLALVVAPDRTQIEAGEQRVLMREMGIL